MDNDLDTRVVDAMARLILMEERDIAKLLHELWTTIAVLEEMLHIERGSQNQTKITEGLDKSPPV